MRPPPIARAASFVAVCAALTAACGGSGDDAAPATTAQATTGEPSAAATTMPAETTLPPVVTSAPDTAPATTLAPATTEVRTGPASTQLLVPGNPTYFDAFGADVIRIEAEVPGSSTVAVLDRDGNGYQSWSSDARDRTVWMQDGELFDDVDGLLEPTLFPGGSFPFVLDGEIGFPADEGVMALLVPGDEIEGGEGRVFDADPAEVLAYQISDHPEWWEWASAEVSAEANHDGALVVYREASAYTVIAPSNMVDPPPPRDVVDEYALTIESTEREPFPADRIHPEADDILAQRRLEQATLVHSRQIELNFFGSGSSDPDGVPAVTVDDLNSLVADFFAERFLVSFGTVEEAGGSVVGYEDNTLVIESPDGTWFCQAGRRNAAEFLEVDITGSGPSARAAWDACEAQRS